MEKMRLETPDLTAANVEKIGALFPNCITEMADENGKLKKAVNFDLLRQMLSGDVVEGDEAYEFTWVGKKAAIVEANKPIRKTLRPCPEESVDWDNTENLYIEGDNLEVLKLLQESYLEKIKIIYIDPPYNTGHDFVYPDSFKMNDEDYDDGTGYLDEEGNINYSRENNPTSGKYHSDWCSMMYSRLMLARTLLSSDGLIFISINEIEQANLEKICNEVFGASNHVSTFVWKNKYGPGAFTKGVASLHEFILCYAKNYPSNVEATLSDDEMKKYKMTDEKVAVRGGYITQPLATRSKDDRPNLVYPLIHEGKEIWPNKQWIWEKSRLYDAYNKGEVVVNEKNGQYSVRFKQYLRDENGVVRKGKPLSLLTFCFNQDGTKEMEDLLGRGVFDFPKPTELIKYFLSLRINEQDDNEFIVLDFFSGSATTAHATLKINAEDNGRRKFIMVQVPEKCPEGSTAQKTGFSTIPEIAKERIRRAGAKLKEDSPLTTQKLDIGFRVFKLDDSNMNDVYYSAGEYTQDLLTLLESNVKPDRSDLDLLFGCLLEWGLPLSMPYKSEKIEGCTVHTYNNGDLIACFDENIPDAVIKEIAHRQPLRAVFRDSSFNGSPAKINVGEIFKMLAPDTRVKVI
ncbi:MAG: site-specific DNA-methyltransferase [Oscillospiraceae bacterium]|nr:site-specific DNA-methyltransferase [Oscillospiraceae bacterium]